MQVNTIKMRFMPKVAKMACRFGLVLLQSKTRFETMIQKFVQEQLETLPNKAVSPIFDCK